MMAVVGAQEERCLTLTQTGSIKENLLAVAKMGGTLKVDLRLDLDIITIKLHEFGEII